MKTLAELKSTQFQGISAEHIEAIQYIEKMAGLTRTPIDSWDIFKVFNNGDNGLLVDRRAINKRLHSHGLLSETQRRQLTDLENTAMEAFQVRMREQAESLAQQALANRDYSIKDATSLRQRMEASITNAKNYDEQARNLEGKTPNIAHEVGKIIDAGFWEVESILYHEIHFTTKNPIVLTENNASAGVHFHVPMGHYKVIVFAPEARLRVKQFKDNVVFDGYYHPYVNESGVICWGNAQDTANKMLARQEYAHVLELLAALLTTYVPEATPYAQLLKFQIEYDKAHRTGFFSLGCDTCGNAPCQCVTCEICQDTNIRHCRDHWCDLCQTYTRENNDCPNCTPDDDRCSECEYHVDDGHADGCSNSISV